MTMAAVRQAVAGSDMRAEVCFGNRRVRAENQGSPAAEQQYVSILSFFFLGGACVEGAKVRITCASVGTDEAGMNGHEWA